MSVTESLISTEHVVVDIVIIVSEGVAISIAEDVVAGTYGKWRYCGTTYRYLNVLLTNKNGRF